MIAVTWHRVRFPSFHHFAWHIPATNDGVTGLLANQNVYLRGPRQGGTSLGIDTLRGELDAYSRINKDFLSTLFIGLVSFLCTTNISVSAVSCNHCLSGSWPRYGVKLLGVNSAALLDLLSRETRGDPK